MSWLTSGEKRIRGAKQFETAQLPTFYQETAENIPKACDFASGE